LLEVGGVGPAADGEEDFEVPVAAFEEGELLETAVEVCSWVVPAVVFPVDVCVCPGVGEVAGWVLVCVCAGEGWGTYTSPESGLTLAKA
jgi:hypothetical protein